MLQYAPFPSIKSVKCSLLGSNSHELLLYIIHKYPQLRKLEINFSFLRPLQLDTFAVTKFLDYISKIDTPSIYDFTLKQNILADGILKLGLRNFKKWYTEVAYNGARFMLAINSKRDHNKAGANSLTYFGYGCDFDWQMYMDYMVKGGEFIQYLRFDFARNSRGTSEKYVLPDNFMPHTLTLCTNLQHLRLERCVLKQISCTDINIGKNATLNKLDFEDVILYDGIFEQISALILQVNKLNLSSVKFFSGTIEEPHNSIIYINMPHTNINSILIEGDN